LREYPSNSEMNLKEFQILAGGSKANITVMAHYKRGI
jgi:hypothetical protein